MRLICEVCGSPLRGNSVTVEIDGAILKACPSCSKLGKPIIAPPPAVRSVRLAPEIRIPRVNLPEPELELTDDFPKLIRQAREKTGLSQEELGRRINEKPSVIRLLEGGRLRPDDMLARKVERFLKVRLLVASQDE